MRRLIATAALAVCATAASAAPITAQQIFQQFNLVTSGSVTSTSHVDGRAYIGGSLNGSGAVFAMHGNTMPASAYSGLTVAGAASGFHVNSGGLTALGSISNAVVNNGAAAVAGAAANTNFNGNRGGSWVGGAKSGVNANSGALSSSAAAAMFTLAQTGAGFDSVLAATSQSLAGLASTGSWWAVNGSRVTFHAVAGADGIAVFDLTAVDHLLLAMAEFDFVLGDASAAIFNLDVASATVNANFLGGSAVNLGSKLLWNFAGASSLTLNSQFGGTVLATGAALTNRNNIEGGVYVSTLNQQGEIHQRAFTGTLPTTPGGSTSTPVPLPGTLALGLLALGLLAGLRRR